MTHTFNWKGVQITAIEELSEGRARWLLIIPQADGCLLEYKIFFPGFVDEVIKVDYAWFLRRPSGEIQSSGRNYYYEKNLLYYYNATLPPNLTYGPWAGRNAINGLVDRLAYFGGSKAVPSIIRVFALTGEPVQPVGLTVAHHAPTPTSLGSITATAHDGSGPFSFTLTAPDGTKVTSATGVFSDLGPGEYKILVRDAASQANRQTVLLEMRGETLPPG